MSIAFLIIGLIAGAAAGYYYATFMEQPASDAMMLDDGTQTQDQTQDQIDQTMPADTDASTTDTGVDANAEASTGGALDDVQTNPFQ